MTKAAKVREKITIGNRLAPLRFLLFLIGLVAGYFAYRAGWPDAKWSDGVATAFDAAAIVFLASLVPLLRDSEADAIRGHAAANDANRFLILVVTSLLSVVAMAAIAGELDGARGGQLPAVLKLVVTLLLVWLFANSIYALHYAHAYYTRSDEAAGDAGGLEFPGTKMPGYSDFCYFAFTLGMTFQTSDCAVGSPAIRRVMLGQCMAAFVFNLGVLAFTINSLGS